MKKTASTEIFSTETLHRRSFTSYLECYTQDTKGLNFHLKRLPIFLERDKRGWTIHEILLLFFIRFVTQLLFLINSKQYLKKYVGKMILMVASSVKRILFIQVERARVILHHTYIRTKTSSSYLMSVARSLEQNFKLVNSSFQLESYAIEQQVTKYKINAAMDILAINYLTILHGIVFCQLNSQ